MDHDLFRQILHIEQVEFTWKVYETQKITNTKGDWYEIVKKYKVENGILESEHEISSMSQNKFKKSLEKKIHLAAIKHLQELAGKHSKSTKIAPEKFG